MKKNLTKVLVGVSALAVLSGTLIGCRRKKDNPNNLDIYITNAGYRYEWVSAIKDLFLEEDWVQEKYPKLNVTIYQNDDQNYTETIMDAGKSSNRFDLMFGMNLAKFNGSEDVADLTDEVYNKEIPGTNTLFKDAIFQSYLQSYEYYPKGNHTGDPKYYFAPWAGGMDGIIYNEFFFNENSYKVPNTTDELVSICNDYHNKGKYCFIQGNDENYFNSLFDIFWGQYQSIEGFINFWNGIDDGALSKGIFEQKGRLEALKVFDQLVHNNFVSEDSDFQNFMSNQRQFLKGKSLMNVNGDWFVSEMKEIKEDIKKNDPVSAQYSFKMMRTPIISSIINLCDTIDDDTELSALITAIDKDDPKLIGTGYDVSQEDYDKIKEARSVVTSHGSTHQAIIPIYALRKDAAIDFLRFMATSKAQDAYIKATDGASLPFSYDLKTKNPTLYNEIDPLHQDRITYLNSEFIKPYSLPSKYNFPLNKYGGVDAFYLSGGYDFFTKMRKDNKKPNTYYDETIAYYTDERWEDVLRRAGLK